jgi:glycosyltransferase involved in cell wall biosynthesis
MKVALLSSGLVPLPPLKGGAVEEYVFQLAKHLRTEGIDAVAIDRATFEDKQVLYEHDGAIILKLKTTNIPSHIPKRNMVQELVFGLSSVKELEKYDIVHANTALAGFAVAGRLKNVMLVYTCHNPFWPQDKVHLSERIIRIIESFAMRRAVKVIALNKVMKKALQLKAGLNESKLVTIPNGVDTEYFRPDVNAGYQVNCLIRNPVKAMFLKNLGANLVKGDLNDFDMWKDLLKDCDIIIHAAAIRGERFIGWEKYYRVNVLATVKLLEIALKYNIPRFIFISSVGVLGTSPKQLPANEETVYNPDCDYHRSKMLAEQAILRVSSRGGSGH